MMERDRMMEPLAAVQRLDLGTITGVNSLRRATCQNVGAAMKHKVAQGCGCRRWVSSRETSLAAAT